MNNFENGNITPVVEVIDLPFASQERTPFGIATCYGQGHAHPTGWPAEALGEGFLDPARGHSSHPHFPAQ